ncbi:hypothetical protein B9Z55_003155 [Caenorhabditis nigoni]|nr:hypothetical protein B9Z55_003155 [Caenorhabditis nigoni]
MKFQFLILLALVGFGASQHLKVFAEANDCFEASFRNVTSTGGFNDQAILKAKEMLFETDRCDAPDECFPEFKETMIKSSIPDGLELVKHLEEAFGPCFEILNVLARTTTAVPV